MEHTEKITEIINYHLDLQARYSASTGSIQYIAFLMKIQDECTNRIQRALHERQVKILSARVEVPVKTIHHQYPLTPDDIMTPDY